ncbi:unnamed protein product [Chilo suppressalis]|uniref:C2H2-type domain-containing protein n=1 Tax=Chilo suppressalis TaxID=168631 RepID=A0ABN8BFY7_CHISP|nr:hypothetical protein evm_005945 [Chilo suppressalis]CAH0406062.1 unnamed protein product [Chilo suppressalis]
MPVITLEVLSDSSNAEHYIQTINNNLTDDTSTVDNATQDSTPGVHFLTEKTEDVMPKLEQENKDPDAKETPKARNDLLEYFMRNDGSVVCKLCGEILQSRTHWYRHKYKLHVIHPLNPAPLFQCEQCLVYFKSRKGYIGHLASRHSETLSDSSPVLTNSQAEALAKERVTQQPLHEVKEEPDPEMSIPKTSVPNYQTTVVKQTKSGEVKKTCRGSNRETQGSDQSSKTDWQEKRSREEKLVADIIDRVRRECEAQGSGGATRRGYTRRTTVMNT